MVLYKSLINFLGLNDEKNQFITFGVYNNLILFIDSILSEVFLIYSAPLGVGLVKKPFLIFVSTVFFSVFLKRKGARYQETILNKYHAIPFFVYILIQIELFFTRNVAIGFAGSALIGLLFFMMMCTKSSVCFLVIKHLLLLYTLFRSLLNNDCLEGFCQRDYYLYKYTEYYIVAQKKEIRLNRIILLLFVLLVVFSSRKLYILYMPLA